MGDPPLFGGWVTCPSLRDSFPFAAFRNHFPPERREVRASALVRRTNAQLAPYQTFTRKRRSCSTRFANRVASFSRVDERRPKAGKPAVRTPRAPPFFGRDLETSFLFPPAAVTRRTPRKGRGPMGGRSDSPRWDRSGEAGPDRAPHRAPSQPGPCQALSLARTWRG
jgi:hypothetical protein